MKNSKILKIAKLKELNLVALFMNPKQCLQLPKILELHYHLYMIIKINPRIKVQIRLAIQFKAKKIN